MLKYIFGHSYDDARTPIVNMRFVLYIYNFYLLLTFMSDMLCMYYVRLANCVVILALIISQK